MLSPHPADPTLTTDNLMEVVKGVKHCWEDLGFELGFPKVGGQLVDVDWKEIHGMADVVDKYVRHDPTSILEVRSLQLLQEDGARQTGRRGHHQICQRYGCESCDIFDTEIKT